MKVLGKRTVLFLLAVWLLASAGLAPASAAETKSAPKAKAASSGAVVDLNAAGADELAEVPGIGDSIAKRIIEFRDKNGPFQSVDDLLKVQGIGEKSLQKLRPHLTVAKAR